jgi:hypothetical protein
MLKPFRAISVKALTIDDGFGSNADANPAKVCRRRFVDYYDWSLEEAGIT